MVVAKKLKIVVSRNQVQTVNLSLPANSCRWIIDLIPDDILIKIKERGIDIEKIQNEFKSADVLVPKSILNIETEEKIIQIYLE